MRFRKGAERRHDRIQCASRQGQTGGQSNGIVLVQRSDIPAPGESLLAALKMGVHLMRQGDYITDYEVKLGGKIAEVLCGGEVTPGTPLSEQYVLDLEREAFKSLCGERKTQERIQHTLKTGKTLRN